MVFFFWFLFHKTFGMEDNVWCGSPREIQICKKALLTRLTASLYFIPVRIDMINRIRYVFIRQTIRCHLKRMKIKRGILMACVWHINWAQRIKDWRQQSAVCITLSFNSCIIFEILNRSCVVERVGKPSGTAHERHIPRAVTEKTKMKGKKKFTFSTTTIHRTHLEHCYYK